MAEIKTTEQKSTQRLLQIVVFKLGNEEYGLHIDQIKEVVITPAITRMPQTPSYVKGVANIRGNVIAIFDLEDRFNLTRTIQDRGSKYTLVVESEDVKLGLLVNEVPNTISVNASDLDESVGIINDSSSETNYIKGIIKSGKRLIILIDIFKVIDHEMTSTIKKGSSSSMIEYKLNIGDVATSKGAANYTCFGLGSCVGLFIQDRVTGLSGGAHIFLPGNEVSEKHTEKFYNVTTALDELLKQFKLQGSALDSLRAKITGGANVVSLNYQTGKRNVDSVLSHLTAKKIFIAAMDVGGSFCRTAKFESNTGMLTVKIPVTNEYKIY